MHFVFCRFRDFRKTDFESFEVYLSGVDWLTEFSTCVAVRNFGWFFVKLSRKASIAMFL